MFQPDAGNEARVRCAPLGSLLPLASFVLTTGNPDYRFRLITPSNVPDPALVAVAKSISVVARMVKVPVAAANRPVPPDTVATTVVREVLGGTNASSWPAVVANS